MSAFKILRGKRDAIIKNHEEGKQLQDGQLLYNSDDNQLSIGGGKSGNALNKLPISCREIKGYAEDVDELSLDSSTEFYIKYSDGKMHYKDSTGEFSQSNIKDGQGIASLQMRDGDDPNINYVNTALGNGSMAIGDGNISSGAKSIAAGTRNKSIGNSAAAFGQTGTAYNSGTITSGNGNKAYGGYSAAIGYQNTTGAILTHDDGTPKYFYKQTSNKDKQWINPDTGEQYPTGQEILDLNLLDSINWVHTLIGTNDQDNSSEVLLGSGTTYSGWGATALGWNTIAGGSGSLSSGYKTKALGKNSVALGTISEIGSIQTEANGNASLAVGAGVKAIGKFSFAQGSRSIASGDNSIAFGSQAEAYELNALAIGNQAKALAKDTIAIGAATEAKYPKNIAIGEQAKSGYTKSGFFNIAVGNYCISSGADGITYGYGSKATGNFSVALGKRAEAKGDYSIAIGTNASGQSNPKSSVAATGSSSISIGSTNTAAGEKAITIGSECSADSRYDVTIGYDNTLKSGSGYNDGRVVLGNHLETNFGNQILLGKYNDPLDTAYFAIANGSQDQPKNIISIFPNGTLEAKGSLKSDGDIIAKGVAKPLAIGLNQYGDTATGHGGYIDFHFAGSQDDYTSRIIEYSAGKITVEGRLESTVAPQESQDVVRKIDLLDLIYPVGSIYISLGQSPAVFLGGSWELLPGGYYLESCVQNAGLEDGPELPNITGQMKGVAVYNADSSNCTPGATNAFTSTQENSSNNDGIGQDYATITISANKSNAIYKDGGTVKPLSIKVYMYKRVS